jgi:hypothetical protein
MEAEEEANKVQTELPVFANIWSIFLSLS